MLKTPANPGGTPIEVFDQLRAGVHADRAQFWKDLSLVAYDPQWRLITDVIPCEDGHAQERALLGEVLPLVQPQDAWVADQNFCTTDFRFGIAARKGFFVIRQHAQNLRWTLVGERQYCGRTDGSTCQRPPGGR